MWLLNTTSFELEFVVNYEGHSYAILSHTWGDGEVTFQEMAHLRQARKKKGFSKIRETCRLAREKGISYAWIDTCCIDKSSSAELTEAINSMFNWYKASAICFAFLSDLEASGDIYDPDHGLQRCRWFTRGWTLQELVAPVNIEFYDQSWKIRGDRRSLKQQLSKITGVDIEVIENSDLLTTIPVARRMSWASKRQTTRVEDSAYSLMGIFDVNMPLIYGEGPKAFIRLQEEIIKQYNDLSIFAWTPQNNTQEFQGCLARSASEFQECGRLRRNHDLRLPPSDFETTNRGVRLTAWLYYVKESNNGDCLLSLECKNGYPEEVVVLRLAPTPYGYARRCLESLGINASSLGAIPTTVIHIPKTISYVESSILGRQFSHRFSFRLINKTSWELQKDFPQALPSHLWNALSNNFTTAGQSGFEATLLLYFQNKKLIPFVFRCSIEIGLRAVEMFGGFRATQEPLIPWARIYQHSYYQDGSEITLAEARNQASTSLKVVSDERYSHTSLRDYLRQTILMLSVSTNVSTNRKSGMYEVVLTMEEQAKSQEDIPTSSLQKIDL